MKNNEILKILFALLIIVSLFNFLIYKERTGPDMILGMHFSVVPKNHVGFSADTDSLYFGSAPIGGYSTRSFTIDNYGSISKRVIIVPKGELAEWAYLSENNVILPPNSNKTIEATIYPSENATLGNYTGKLYFYFRKV